MESILKPKLIEPETKYHLWQTLQSCHDKRKNVFIGSWNLIIFLVFISVFGLGLYFCYIRRKRNLEEGNQKEKMQKDQEYILTKIRALKELDSYRNQMKSVTQLPIPVSEKLAPNLLPDHPSGYAY